MKEILEYDIEHKGIICYTKIALIMSLLRIPYKHTAYCCFCSGFVADVLQSSGAVELKKSNRCFSEDLKRLPGMKLHCQGNLKSMLNHFEIMPALHETMNHYENTNYNRFIHYNYKRCCDIDKESFQRAEEKRA